MSIVLILTNSYGQFLRKKETEKVKNVELIPFEAMPRTPGVTSSGKFDMSESPIVIRRYMQNFIKILVTVFEKFDVFQKVGIGKKTNSSPQ